MKHCITRDGVILRIGTTHSRDNAAKRGLLMKDIVELQRNGKGFTLEETLRQLSIPDKFVGIQRSIVVAASTLHVHISSESSTPRCSNANHATIGELPCVEVIILLQIVT